MKIRDVAATRVGRQADGIRIRHAVAHQSDAVDVHVDEVGVVVAGQIAIDVRRPDSRTGVAPQRLERLRGSNAVSVQAQRHVARGRSPQRDPGAIRRDRRTEFRVRGTRVQRVQCPGRLQARRPQHAAVCTLLHEQQLLAMEFAQGVGGNRQPQRDTARDMTKARGNCGWERVSVQLEVEGTGCTRDRGAGLRGHAAVGRMVQPEASAGFDAGPAQELGIEPDGPRIGQGRLSCGLQHGRMRGGIAVGEGRRRHRRLGAHGAHHAPDKHEPHRRLLAPDGAMMPCSP